MRAFAVLMLVGLLLSPNVAAAQAGPARRFALLVGSNAGGGARKELRYAISDAANFARVLGELGGVQQGDTTLLQNPDARALEAALNAQRDRVARAGASAQRTEFVFYYSGHSDDEGLRLGEALVPYPALRTWLERVHASVRIVVLDSCASGSFTREKGGVQVAPFLFDASIDVQGQAVLTASAESEAAQESDRLGGSFFTHYLVAGLRGAADSSRDGRVTLTEAYRYAFDETLSRTGRTQGGAQHPSYDIRLSGTGDLVITELRANGARLTLEGDVSGRLFVRDGSGQLLLELTKRPGARTTLSLPAGRYVLLLERDGGRFEAQVALGASEAVMASAAFVRVRTEPTSARGGPALRLQPVGFSFVPPYDTYGDAPRRTYLGLHALYGEPAALSGAALSLGGNGVSERADGLLMALAFNRTNEARGVALALGANASRTRTVGLSAAGLFNLGRGDHDGLAFAFGFNGLRRARGLELSGLNLNREALIGVAVGGLSAARTLVGAEVSMVNWAGSLRGVQLGGLNLAGDAQGVQLGFVNVATGDVAGAQIGLVNYARSVDAGIAPFSITREGGVHAQLVSGTLSAVQLALRFDARYTYSFFGVGWHPFGRDATRSYLFGGGFGGKIPIVTRLSAELDGAAYLVQPLVDWVRDVPTVATEARLVLRVELHKHLSVLAGLTFDVLANRNPVARVYPGFTDGGHRARHGDLELRYGPGWVAGLRF